jgi:hydrogenase expression/formation protein HypC
MCLAIPARILSIAEDGESAQIDVDGVRRPVSLALVEGCAVGDYVVVHVGFALSRLDPIEAERTLALFAEAGLTGGAGA